MVDRKNTMLELIKDIPVNASVNGNVSVNVNGSVDVSKKRRKKSGLFEDRHIKKSYWIEKEVFEQFDLLCGDDWGSRTHHINEALKNYLRNTLK